MSQSSKPIPLAVPNDLLSTIDRVAEIMGKTRAEIMRMAMEVGLEDLRQIDYNVPMVVVKAAKGDRKAHNITPYQKAKPREALEEFIAGQYPLDMVAEDPPAKAGEETEVTIQPSAEDLALLKAGASAARARTAVHKMGKKAAAKPSA